MFLLAFLGQYASLVKVVVVALFAAIASFLGLNYIRRGQQIDTQKQQIKELNVKAGVTAKNVDESKNLQKIEDSINNEKSDKLLDDVNHLHK